MKRFLKWATLVIVAAEVVLVGFGVLDVRDAVGLVIAIEVLLLLLGIRAQALAVREYRRDRSRGLDRWAALETAFAAVLPRSVARIGVFELRLPTLLFAWLFRRRRPGPEDFGYNRRSILGQLLVVVAVSAPAELLLFQVLIPWDWARWLHLVATVYGLLWIFGVYASMQALPHRLEADALRVQYGVLAEGRIPYADIESVEVKDRRPPGGGEGLRLSPKQTIAYLAVGGRTDVTLVLRTPHVIRGLLHTSPPVRMVCLAADDPEALASALQRRLSRGSSVTAEVPVLVGESV